MITAKSIDKNGNTTFLQYSNGYKKWYYYDKNNKLIYTKDSLGKKTWKNYK